MGVNMEENILCELCAMGRTETLATITVPEPKQGAFGCTPGTFQSGITRCEGCARQWQTSAGAESA